MTHMLETEQTKQQRQVLFEQECYAQRKAWLKERGGSSQNAELLPKDSDKPTPSRIARDLEKFAHARTVAEQDTRCQAALKAFKGAWLKETERVAGLHKALALYPKSFHQKFTGGILGGIRR